jgi:hypothetical protein
MGSRGGVKALVGNHHVLNVFQEFLGEGSGIAAPEVAVPKLAKLQREGERFRRAVQIVGDALALEPLRAWAAQFQAELDRAVTVPGLFGSLETLLQESPGLGQAAAATYATAKKSVAANAMVVTCQNLLPHQSHLSDIDRLRDAPFRGAGLTLEVLPALGGDAHAFNAKAAWAALPEDGRKTLLLLLHKLLTIGRAVYEVVTSPDVNVSEFAEVVKKATKEMRKQFHDCGDAITRIEASIGLLEGNFPEYYKAYTASGNPTVILENFVLDTAKSSGSNPRLLGQFTRLIKHFREMAARNGAVDPHFNGILNHLDKNLKNAQENDAGGGGDRDRDDEGAAAAADSGVAEETDSEVYDCSDGYAAAAALAMAAAPAAAPTAAPAATPAASAASPTAAATAAPPAATPATTTAKKHRSKKKAA